MISSERRLELRAEARRRAYSLGGGAKDREAAASTIEAELVAAEEAQLTAVAAQAAEAEAAAERQRVAAVVAEGERFGKGRAALALALAGPVDAETARSLLSALPPDATTPPAPLPNVQSFGSEARRAERARITSIFAHPEAEGREQIARRFAFGTSFGIDIFEAVAATTPKTARYDGPSIAERSAAAGDFGYAPATYGGAKGDDGWAAAIAKANRDAFGSAAATPAQAAQPVDNSAALFAQVERWRQDEGR